MKFNLLLIVLFFYASSILGQELSPELQGKVDSIKSSLEKEADEIEYIKSLRAWDNLIYINNPKQDIELLSEIRERCEKKLKDSLLTDKELKFFLKEYGNALNDLGLAYMWAYRYKEALEVSFEALKFYEKNGTLIKKVGVLNNIGILYSKMDDNKRAIKYFDKVIESDLPANNLVLADALNNKGLELNKLEQAKEAIILLYKAAKIYEATDQKLELGNSLVTIGKSYYELDKLDSAKHFLKEGLKNHKIVDNKVGIASANNALAKMELELGKNKQAIALAGLANENAHLVDDLEEKMVSRKTLAAAHKALSNTNEALKNLELYYTLKDSLENTLEKDLALQLDLKYEYEKRAITDSLNLVKQTALITQKHEESLEGQKTKTIVAIAILIIIGIISVLIVIAYRQKKASNRLLSEKYALIEESLKDKELFMKEIHHRVKNNMQMVSSVLQLKSTETENEVVKTELLDSQSRIHSMSLAHKKMYESNNFEELNLKTYINDIITAVFEVNSNIELDDYTLEGEDTFINIEQAQALGFIMHELSLNSIKHAWNSDQKKTLFISLTKEKEQLKVIFQDNGSGMSENFAIEKVKSMGLKLVRSFIRRQLNGSVKFISNNGLLIEILFTPRKR